VESGTNKKQLARTAACGGTAATISVKETVHTTPWNDSTLSPITLPFPVSGFSKTRPPGLKQFPRCSYPKITPFDYSNSFSPLHFLLSLPLRIFLKKNIVNVDIHTLILLGAPQKTRLTDLKIYETTIVKDDLLSMRYSLPLK
jgi:hypothetical protein